METNITEPFVFFSKKLLRNFFFFFVQEKKAFIELASKNMNEPTPTEKLPTNKKRNIFKNISSSLKGPL